MDLLEAVKAANRITTDDPGIVGELEDLIEAAKRDLIISGVDPFIVELDEEADPLIRRAVILYTKANFGFDNPDSDKLNASYLSLKQHLSLAGDYHALE